MFKLGMVPIAGRAALQDYVCLLIRRWIISKLSAKLPNYQWTWTQFGHSLHKALARKTTSSENCPTSYRQHDGVRSELRADVFERSQFGTDTLLNAQVKRKLLTSSEQSMAQNWSDPIFGWVENFLWRGVSTTLFQRRGAGGSKGGPKRVS